MKTHGPYETFWEAAYSAATYAAARRYGKFRADVTDAERDEAWAAYCASRPVPAAAADCLLVYMSGGRVRP